jgi:hypothetical protein
MLKYALVLPRQLLSVLSSYRNLILLPLSLPNFNALS